MITQRECLKLQSTTILMPAQKLLPCFDEQEVQLKLEVENSIEVPIVRLEQFHHMLNLNTV